jgi:hypothetical protein
MKRPATATVVVVLVILLATAAIVAAVGLGTDGATAITVGDQKLSKQSFNDELNDWADFAASKARSTDGSVTATAGSTITTQTIYEMLADSYLERTGEKVTAADRKTAADSVAGSADFKQASQSFRDRYLMRQATFAALTRLVGTDDQGTTELRVLRREARRTGVSVAAAYGRFAPVSVRVVPYPTPFTPTTSAQG